jgi:hypothetical protein
VEEADGLAFENTEIESQKPPGEFAESVKK